MPYALVLLLPGPRFDARPRVAPRHRAFMEALIARGVVLCGGPLDGPGEAFGAYVLRCPGPTEGARVAAEDPYVREGVCVAKTRAWKLVGIDPRAIEPGLAPGA